MRSPEKVAATADELIALAGDAGVRHIVVRGGLTGVPSVRLSPGQSLRGEGDRAVISFADGTDGLQLSADNRVQDIRLNASPDRRAIFNDTGVDGLGRIELRGVTTTGRVQILARDKVRGGHVEVKGLDILAADARGEADRPQGYGVSGIFVSGAGDKGGRLVVRRLETEAVYSDGRIAPGTPDQITGGVFTVHGAHAEFDRVTTHADGAVGIQISQPIGRLVVRRGIETFGGTGQSLVKGVVMTLSAIGLSIKPGGSAREIEIGGGIRVNGPGVAPIEQHGSIESLRIAGGCVAAGGGFDRI
jgi:hypothetical protein